MLKKVVNNISKLSVNSLAQKVLKESGLSRFIIDLNRSEQLFEEGVGVDGKVVGKYTYATQVFSQGVSGKGFPKNAGDPFNFYNTGNMFNSFSLRIENDGFIINADTTDLIEGSRTIKSDKQILGLTDESTQELTQKIIPFVAKEVRKQILG